MDEEVAAQLRQIFNLKANIADDARYDVQGKPEEQRLKGEVKAFRWSASFMRHLEEEDASEILDEELDNLKEFRESR